MNFAEAIDIIHRIETECAVNDLRYGDYQVWPLVRLKLWMALINFNRADIQRRTMRQRVKEGTAFATLLAQQRWQRESTPGPVDVVFVSRASTHTDTVQGRAYDRLLDPMIALLAESQRWRKLEALTTQTAHTLPRHVPTQFTDTFSTRVLNGLRDRLNLYGEVNRYIPGLSDLLKCIERFTNGSGIDAQGIVSRAIDIALVADVFEQKLKQLRPKALFIAVYYDNYGFSALLAAHRLGITTVDVQHGKQGKFHGAYDLWQALPEGGYTLLPDYFWTWGSESVANMRRSPDRAQLHVPLIGGNRWLAQWVENPDFYAPPAAAAPFYERVTAAEKTILFALQPLDEPLHPHVIQAMRDSPANWLWLIRLHPVQRPLIEDIRARLHAAGVTNCELDFATAEPLYALLQRVDHHLTAWSTVCYEALAFDVPTTIIDPNGAELFADYIQRGIFTYADAAPTLLEYVQHAVDHHRHSAVTDPYIVVDRVQAVQALNRILES